MAPTSNAFLYDEVVKITDGYFGPAAHRFVTRQISNHLGKKPEQLRKQDLDSLIDWMSMAMAVIIEDEALINHYVADLTHLAKG